MYIAFLRRQQRDNICLWFRGRQIKPWGLYCWGFHEKPCVGFLKTSDYMFSQMSLQASIFALGFKLCCCCRSYHRKQRCSTLDSSGTSFSHLRKVSADVSHSGFFSIFQTRGEKRQRDFRAFGSQAFPLVFPPSCRK